MRLILNLIWLILCGWWMAILYALAGVICFILIITIPFGIGMMLFGNIFGEDLVIVMLASLVPFVLPLLGIRDHCPQLEHLEGAAVEPRRKGPSCHGS